MAKVSNPIAFAQGPVTVLTSLIYLALVVTLLIVQTGVPSFPKSPTPVKGVNLTEAWHDLQLLTASYHPFNSRQNDYIHDWLLLRLESIIIQNTHSKNKTASPPAYVFNDTLSNLTFSSPGSTNSASGISVYFEGLNIIVYIPGTEDRSSPEWWKDPQGKPYRRNGVLVNAHYDSVSTGFGATDDGMGIIAILQLVKYYTTSGNQPKHSIVLLLNDGEEDFLNGARVFSQHPMAKLVSTFLNLEGAGAGGRATLFRSSDAEVTQAYSSSPYPFGSVITADGFNRGLVRSQTDYVVFNGIMGLRGLDVAFIEPRARYHTDQDDSRHASKASLWHMLSAALATTKKLSSKALETNLDPKNPSGNPSVWFDILGRQFAVFQTYTLFSLSVTLLVAGPIFLFLTLAILYRVDKLYLFAHSRDYHMVDGEEDIVPLYGWRGFFRFPLVIVCACAAPIALAYLLFKENEMIAHSSEWAVWSMMISSFIFVAWFLCRVAEFARPSALTRAYGLSWMCTGWWSILVAATVFEEQLHVAGGYFVLFYSATVFLSTFLSYLEFFSLPKKATYCLGKFGEGSTLSRSRSGSRHLETTAAESTQVRGEAEGQNEEEEEPTERSGLLQSRGRSVFKKYSQSEEETANPEHEKEQDPYEEQEWAKSQWSWIWLLQVLIVVPINLVIVGQIALTMVTGLHQTGADGSSMFLVYLGIAIFTIILFSPLVPFIHRFTWHIPIFLLLVLIGTLIYNVVAFPFSPQNRLKLFFQQEVNLHYGNNSVSLTGISPFVEAAISNFPSAAGQRLDCVKIDSTSHKKKCSWQGITPKVVKGSSKMSFEPRYKTWVNFNVTQLSNKGGRNETRFVVYGKDTRSCKIVFDSPIKDFKVHGQAPVDDRFPPVPKTGSNEIRLWSRTWDRAWTVDAKWGGDGGKTGMTGKVVCMWSDANLNGVIPAFDEAQHYAPEWVAITKAGDGLVEGYKRFTF